MTWNIESIGNQNGRMALITGANSGIGFETAKALAGAGAEVILACRSPKRAEEAKQRIQQVHPDAQLHFHRLDLADLEQVKVFASEIRDRYARLDLLINNAGLMFVPESRTEQGYEMQFGVNHLGHFALTGLLLPLLTATPDSRVVTVSSLMHRVGAVRFDDLNYDSRRFTRWSSYGQSKLANLLFANELQRRLDAAGLEVKSLAAHPGWTATSLQRHNRFIQTTSNLLAMSAPQGALPTLRAAIDVGAAGGEYFGPDGFMEVRGAPGRAHQSRRARNETDAAFLWQRSEELTRVVFDFDSRKARRHAPAAPIRTAARA